MTDTSRMQSELCEPFRNMLGDGMWEQQGSQNRYGQRSQVEMSTGPQHRANGGDNGKKNSSKKRTGMEVTDWRHWNSRKHLQLLMETGKVAAEKRNRKHFDD